VLCTAFQGPTDKVGSADISRMLLESDFGKSFKDQDDKMQAAREDVLSFIDQNRVLTIEQATQIRDLTLKPTRTKEEQAQLDSLKAAVVAANKHWTELATKPNMTPEDRTLVQDYADRAQKMNDLGSRWVREFTTEMESWEVKQKSEGNRRARIAIQEVAKQQGYTVIYDAVFAPYTSNDITDASIVAMNAEKP
jgi:Skp family chaperone for outer membrane proteins